MEPATIEARPLAMELREKAAQLPLLPGVYLYKDQYGEVIYVGKAKNLRARVRSYFNDDRLADVKTGTSDRRRPRRRIHPGRQQQRGAGARKQPHQAVEAALQHSAARRQDVSVHQAHQREISARLRDAPPDQGWLHLLRPVFPRQPGAPAGALHSSPLQGSVLQSGSSRDRTRIRAWSITFIAAWDRAFEGLTTDEAYAAAVRDVRLFLEGRHKDLARDLRARMKQASEDTRFEEAAATARSDRRPWKRWRRSRRSPPPKARTSTSWLTMPSRRWWRPTCSICAMAGSSIAANITGRICSISSPTNSSRRCSSRFISISSTSPAASTCRWTSRIARRWRSCSAKKEATKWRS